MKKTYKSPEIEEILNVCGNVITMSGEYVDDPYDGTWTGGNK